MSATAPLIVTSQSQAWINRAIELLWLVAVFLLPLAFFGQDYAQSEAVIAYVEVPKVAVLRTLAGLMAALWLIDWGLHSSPESNISLTPRNLRVLPSLSLAWLKNEILNQPRRWPLIAVGFHLGTTFLSTALSG